MNKRGVSAIITMVLIIMIVVVSIVIIWAVIGPIVEKTGEGAEDGQFSVVLQIEDFEVKPNGDISLIVSRGASGPDLPSLKVFVFDGTDTTTFTTEGLDKMQTKKLTLPSGGLVKEISVAPVFESSGDEKIGNVGANLKFSNKEVMKNLGAVAWWRFEGNADDEVGGHDGTINGNVDCEVSGRFGKGCDLDGSGTVDGVTPGGNVGVTESITNTITDNYPNGVTYSVWINVDTDAVDRMSLFRGAGTIRHIEIYSSLKHFRTEAALDNGYSFGTDSFPDDVRGVWSHFVIVFANNEPEDRTVLWYQNGNLFYTGSMDGGDYPGTEYFSFGSLGRSTGNPSYSYAKSFDGIIDEPMIFNRGLTEEEVKSLYNLDLS